MRMASATSLSLIEDLYLANTIVLYNQLFLSTVATVTVGKDY